MPDTPTRDTVYFYKFNNYYNRIIKRYDTIVEYGEYIDKQENANFVHGDGVNSSFVWNKPANVTDTPDYVIVDDYKGNISRWFVTNSFKTRDRQDRLELRRDLIADYFSDIVKRSPCLIRKGYVNKTSPLIFNDEGVAYNKMKVEERLIKDNSNCSYIIGFFAKDAFNSDTTVNGTVKEKNYAYYYTDLASFPYKNYVEGAGNSHTESATKVAGNNNLNIYYAVKFSGKDTRDGLFNHYTNFEMTVNYYGNAKPSWYTNSYATEERIDNYLYYEDFDNVSDIDSNLIIKYYGVGTIPMNYWKAGKAYRTCCIETAQTFQSRGLQNAALDLLGVEEATYNNIYEFVGKRVKLGNVIYDVSLGEENERNQHPNANNAVTSWMNSSKPFNTMVENMLESYYDCEYETGHNQFSNADIKVLAKTKDYYLVFSEASSDISTEVKASSNRTHLTEYPYDMFMLINEDNIPYKVGANNFVSNHEVNMNIAQAICEASGSAGYDIQIVPFNPIQDTILADNSINFLNYDSHEIKDANNKVVGHYVMCSSADLKLKLEKDELKFNPEDYKFDFNTKQYRLCSPNQETVFDFSPSMNDGINTWEITCNYRPYTSYIKIQPTWNWLYGNSEYNGLTDFRGLVYNSSLCVTQLNDAWATYVNNNKNYQQLFDNQINTLTKQQNIEMNYLEETLGLRSFTGMPIGSIMRTIGGMRDIDMQKELNNLALSKMETDFKYQMDNIKSMPHTIKKLTNINGDTRVFPYIEIYSCSSTEEESFNLKMQYTGYTIMTTGYIWNYLKLGSETFVQADLIRLDLSRSEESADNHVAVEIASELSKGIYITKESE